MNDENFYSPIYSLQLFGLKKYFDEFNFLFNKDCFPKISMLSGKKGIGKFTLVNHLLNSFFDKNNYDFKNYIIDNKSNIYNKIINNIFENVIYLPNVNGVTVKIDDIRNLKSTLLKSTLNTEKRFIIIDDLEFFNLNSINALLKIIEEPTENNYFILINNTENKTIDTLSSRCLKTNIRLNNIERVEIIDNLIQFYNIDKVIEYKINNITPGKFLNYNNFFYKNDINQNDDYFFTIFKILKLFKKNKDKNLINISKFITNYFFYDLCKKKPNNIFFYNEIKLNILNEINKLLVYNVSLDNVLNSIKQNYQNAR